MPPLRKTGVRFPWLPGPILSPNIDPLRSTIVIGAIVPALLLGGIAQPTGWPARVPNVDPLRPTIVQAPPVPLPQALGASVWMPTPARLPNTDPLRPTAATWPPVPIPGAAVWEPAPARDPNTDPLRPLLIAQPPLVPIPGAVTQFVSRPAPLEDVNWPARPAVVQTGRTLLPGANVTVGYAPRDQVAAQPDRIAPAVVIAPQPPVPAGSTLIVGRVTATPTERLALLVATGLPVPAPGAVVARVGTVHDGDRVPGAARVITPPAPPPGAYVLPVGAAHDGDRLPGAVQVIAPLGRAPVGVVRQLAAPRDQVVAAADHLAPTAVQVAQPPLPVAQVVMVGGAREAPATSAPCPLTLPARMRALTIGSRDVDLALPARSALLILDTRGALTLRGRSTVLTGKSC
jgi:hypothetical protein